MRPRSFSSPEEALAKLNKTGTSAKAGVQNVLKRLDSCFRRNDGEGLLQEAPEDKKLNVINKKGFPDTPPQELVSLAHQAHQCRLDPVDFRVVNPLQKQSLGSV